MNGRNYIKQQKLKKDKETFKKKLYLSNNIEFFTTQIKSFSAQIKELTTKKNISTKHQENIEDLLKYYYAQINLRMYPESNYENENTKINLSNINLITNLQEMKKNMLNNDKRILEDNSKDIMYYIDHIRKNKIKEQIKQDIYSLELYEIKKKEYEEISKIIPDLLNKIKELKIYLRQNKFFYEQIMKQNKILEKMLEKQKEIFNQIKQENNGDIKFKNEESNNKKIIGNIRSLSEENLQFINFKSENYYEKHFVDKENKVSKKIHSLLFDNPKFVGYKSKMSFLKNNKMNNRKIIKKYKPVSPYNFLNIFSNNKRYNSIGEFIDNFNTINNKKLSFYTLNSEKASTKMKTISSIFRIKTKKSKKKLFFAEFNIKNNSTKILLFRDYLNDLINQQKTLIKNIINKKAEEIRSNNQIKTFISDCINDINIEIFEIKKNNYNEKLLYILTYIFDNCFSGIKNNNKKLINKSRNNNESNDKNKIKFKRNFSFNDIKFKSI